MTEKIYTSDEILAIESLEPICEVGVISYQLTEGELRWLESVSGRYGIYDYFMENMEDGVLTLDDVEKLQGVLRDDGSVENKPINLSEKTALLRICWNFAY